MTETTLTTNDTPKPQYLYMSMELGEEKWKLGFAIGLREKPRLREVDARDRTVVKEEIRLAKERFGLPPDTPVRSCYEAGRDGFWLHRFLLNLGVCNLIVDSASIEINRRKRRAKTDKLDARKLLTMLQRYHLGETKVWSVVHVPSLEEEDHRQLHRELMALRAEQTHYTNQIKGLLASQGVVLPIRKDFPDRLENARLWDGSPVPAGLQARLKRDLERRGLLQQQIHQLEIEREELVRTFTTDPAVNQVRQLLRLQGIGMNSAWVFVMEFFSWRGFHNRREIGSLAGLTPTPYQSGASYREQGISKAGNRRVRVMAVEIAWIWLRYQPKSKLSQWYQDRFAEGGSRVRRIGITALARHLLIDLWKYLERGEIPPGASLKSV
jgi:transposase